MPWSTPTLRKVREMVRDDITASLYGAAFIGNNVLRVMADAKAGLAHHVLQYIAWLALQLLPDTAETEWLDRHGDIWLVNADGTVGRKMATYAVGEVGITGTFEGVVIPLGTRLEGDDTAYETTMEAMTADGGAPVNVPVRALDPGTLGNAEPGAFLAVTPPIVNVGSTAEVITMAGGTDEENDEDLRIRVLMRIRQPPMGGDQNDYVQWALAVAGVTRAWSGPLEMGMGCVTLRFMMDDLRASSDGFPAAADIQTVTAYLDKVRPVAVKDFFVVAPIPRRVDVDVRNLVPDTAAMRAAIEASLQAMLRRWAAPGATIYAAWKYHAIQDTPGVEHFDLAFSNDDLMPSPGHLAVLGDVSYGVTL